MQDSPALIATLAPTCTGTSKSNTTWANGNVFSSGMTTALTPNTKVILQLLEITPALQAVEGVAMELDDCGFPTLQEVITTDDPNRAFKDVN